MSKLHTATKLIPSKPTVFSYSTKTSPNITYTMQLSSLKDVSLVETVDAPQEQESSIYYKPQPKKGRSIDSLNGENTNSTIPRWKKYKLQFNKAF